MLFNRYKGDAPKEILNWRLWYGVFGRATLDIPDRPILTESQCSG